MEAHSFGITESFHSRSLTPHISNIFINENTKLKYIFKVSLGISIDGRPADAV